MKTFQLTQNWKSMGLAGICIMFQDWDIITEFEDGKHMKREEWKEIDLRHCMVGNLDHHEWHVTFLKHRMVGNLDHHTCCALPLHCMMDNSDHQEWYLHGTYVFQCLWYCS